VKKENELWAHVFGACVWILEQSAKVLDPYWPGGMNYVKINVILFCILLPLVLVVSLGLNLLWLFGRL